jgi:hypothetical protein
MGLGTPDFSSVYGSMTPGALDSGGFGAAAGLKLKEGLGSAAKGASGMAFPWMAAATLGSSVLGGIFGGRQEAANRQLAADLGKMQAESAMQAAFRGAQQNQWNTIVAPEYAYQTQKRAREYQNLFFEPQERYLRSEERRQQYRDEFSPEAREAKSRERQGALAQAALERRALTDAMFGAPVFNTSRYTNAPWMQG